MSLHEVLRPIVRLELQYGPPGVLHNDVVVVSVLNLFLQQCPGCLIVILGLLEGVDSLGYSFTMKIVLLFVKEGDELVSDDTVVCQHHAIAGKYIERVGRKCHWHLVVLILDPEQSLQLLQLLL